MTKIGKKVEKIKVPKRSGFDDFPEMGEGGIMSMDELATNAVTTEDIVGSVKHTADKSKASAEAEKSEEIAGSEDKAGDSPSQDGGDPKVSERIPAKPKAVDAGKGRAKKVPTDGLFSSKKTERHTHACPIYLHPIESERLSEALIHKEIRDDESFKKNQFMYDSMAVWYKKLDKLKFFELEPLALAKAYRTDFFTTKDFVVALKLAKIQRKRSKASTGSSTASLLRTIVLTELIALERELGITPISYD